ncbi:hypothetical protein [Anaerospora hongkongensis]|nr:hypothetical protein [Anaerospora hongkongensis]
MWDELARWWRVEAALWVLLLERTGPEGPGECPALCRWRSE